jgi:undecaprenyl-diphosphatase
MTTFEGIVYGILHGLAEFLPVGAQAHRILVAHFFGLTEPSGVALGALSAGAALAVLLAFRHDWASMLSSLLQIILYRKYPMTKDERMPIFLLITTLPVAAAWHYLSEHVSPGLSTPTGAALGIFAGGLLLLAADRLSRKTKNTYDMNGLDALIAAAGQLLFLIPGLGWSTGIVALFMLRNYRPEAAAKYAYYAALPLLLTSAATRLRGVDFHAPAAADGTTWFTLIIMGVVTAFFGTLTINGFMRQVQKKGLGVYITYRLVVGLALSGWTLIRSRWAGA